MIFSPNYFQIDENIICLYNFKESLVIRDSAKWISDHEEKIFCDRPKSFYIVHYKLLSMDDKNKLKLPLSENYFMLPFHQMGTLYDLINRKNFNFLPFFKKLPNYKNYFAKWVYQLINAIYDIHNKKQLYHGFLSDQCVFIDDKLNAQIGFIGIYDNNSRELFNYNYTKYFDNYRKSTFQTITKNVDKIKFKEILELEEQNPNKVQDFRRHDIYALGILLKDIITSIKDGDADQTFENRIENEIIKLCLEPPESRPNIDKIKTILDQIISENLYNVADTVDIDTLLLNVNLSKLSFCNESQLIATKLKQKPYLMKYLHTASDTNLISFNLHNNYKFKVHYDLNEECFITEPCLCDELGLNLKISTFNDILREKMNDFNRLYFFHNIYFCSLRDLLQIYKPTFAEVHYWLIYLTNYIFGLHSGDFLEEEEEIEPNSVPEAHLPLNFSSETVLVSFFKYDNYKKFEELEKSPLKFQLSIFPFETKETDLSKIYQSNTKEFTVKNDLYSYGVLILELLYAAIFGKRCLDDGNSVAETMKKVIDSLPDDQKFYSNILDGCINKEFKSVSGVLTHLLLQGKSDESDFIQEFQIEKYPSDSLNVYINNNIMMDLKRFIGIFRCYNDFPNDKIKNIFLAILSDLSQKFFSGNNFITDELYFLNFCDFLDSQEKKNKK